jgi:uncharacterized protein YlxP (DUF503 family)
VFVGVLQAELLIRASESLKDKRRVVKSVKDRLHREHLCAVAEVGATEHHKLAVIGVSVVSIAAKRCDEVLGAIETKLAHVRDAELGPVTKFVAQMQSLRVSEVNEFGDPALPEAEAASLEAELLARGAEGMRDADGGRSGADGGGR